MKFGERLKQRRMDLNITAEELGRVIGKNRATIYRYEKGDIESVPISVLEPLAKTLDTSPSYLVGWDEEEVTVGSLLKMMRDNRNMTLEEYSKEIGISPDDLRKYESGEKNIPIEIVRMIAGYYRLTMEGFNEGDVRIQRLKSWTENFGDVDFTDEEHDKIIEYCKFLLYIRNLD